MLFLLAGCKDSLEPPLVVEPAEEAVVDRTRIRVRASSPDDLYSGGIGSGEFGTSIRGHVNWRVDGGAITEVQFPTVDRDEDAPFLFGATVGVGTTVLEVGACDGLDDCAWTAREVTVELRSGSPDPALAGSGQLVLADYDRASYPTPLPDGRVLLGMEDPIVGPAVRMVGADGALDPTFGDGGVALLPVYLGPAYRVLPQPDGGFLVFLIDRVVRLAPDGARDPGFGIDGVATLTAPVGAIAKVTALAPDRTGGYTLAGTTQRDPQDFSSLEEFIVQLDVDGTQVAYVVPDPTGGPFHATDIDADGNVIRLGVDSIRLDTAAGPVASFGAAGTLALPTGTGATDVRFHGDGLVVAQRFLAGSATALRVSLLSRFGVLGAGLDLPFHPGLSGDPLVASAPDGALYVAGALAHPMEPASLVRDELDGSDFAVVRVVDGALDASFGDDGVAHASFMNARTPILLETIYDRPVAMAIGPDGAPWLSGLSIGIETAERDWLRAVDTQVAVARFMP